MVTNGYTNNDIVADLARQRTEGYREGELTDLLTREDWDELKGISDIFMAVQRFDNPPTRSRPGLHDSVWETLPALELLLSHVEQAKARAADQNAALAVSTSNYQYSGFRALLPSTQEAYYSGPLAYGPHGRYRPLPRV